MLGQRVCSPCEEDYKALSRNNPKAETRAKPGAPAQPKYGMTVVIEPTRFTVVQLFDACEKSLHLCIGIGLHLQMVGEGREEENRQFERLTSGDGEPKELAVDIAFRMRLASWTCLIVTNKRMKRARPRAQRNAISRSAVWHVSYSRSAWDVSACCRPPQTRLDD